MINALPRNLKAPAGAGPKVTAMIPDFIPILGYLDDLIITPGGLWLAVRLIPSEVMADARATADARPMDRNIGRIGTILIILAWIITLAVLMYLFLGFTKRI